MADLGTLFFGADIDLTQLKQKINQGNQDILDALKINYDPKSYQDMVSKLKSELSKETFEIKLNANTSNLSQNLRQQLSRSGLTGGIDHLNEKIKDQTIVVNNLKTKLAELQALYKKVTTDPAFTHYDVSSLKNNIARVSSELRGEVNMLNNMRAQREAYVNSTKDTILNLKREAQEHRNASSAALQSARERQRVVRELNSDHLRLNSTLAGGIHVSTRLGSALSMLFAVESARQFLGQVIEIGGQLEKQRISIAAILGDTAKATHLFEQIKGLALKSPFGVVELDQYTKQLAAYGFKQNELFDMTKRLADISAGAGQDIGRLTLALGHVRSATYLTGITLRQFSMNNIPMLKMLSEYYTELEGKIVSTAEVQERISKRQVSYQDVIEQIKRLTDEGGMFYNMQEKISESLAAKFKNLKDAVDIMYGEIAESSFGSFMKGAATDLTALTRHWKEVASMLAVAAGAFMLSKINIGLNTLAVQSNTAATVKQIMADKQAIAAKTRQATITRTLTAEENARIITVNRLTVADLRNALAEGTLTKEDALRLVTLRKMKIAQAMHLVGVQNITKAEIQAAVAANRWTVALKGAAVSIKNAFMGIGAGTWSTIGLMVGAELYSAYSSWAGRIDDKSREMQNVIKSRILDLDKQRKNIDGASKPKNSKEMKARIDDMKQVLANSEAYTKTLDEQLKKTTDTNKQYDILVGAIDKAVTKNKEMLKYQDAIAEMIKHSSGDFWSTDYSENLRWFFNDDITKNIAQTLDAYKNLRGIIDGAWEFKDALKGVIEEMLKSGKVSKDFADQLKNAPFEEQIRILATSSYWPQIVAQISSTNEGFKKFADDIKAASDGVSERWEEIANDDIPRMLEAEAKRRNISEQELNKWCLENIDDFKMMLDGIADQLDLKEPEIRKRLKRMFYDYVRFKNLADQFGGDERGQGMAAGMLAGASIFSDEVLKKLLDDETLADLKDDNPTTNKKEKKDKQLEAAKTKLQQYKAFLSEYKKYRELYSKEKAINMLERLFPDLTDKQGKFLGGRLVDDYINVLDELRNSLDMTTEARKKWGNEIDKTKADTVFDREKEAIKENADAMQEYIKKMEDQWKLYQSLLKRSGGNTEFAALAFNDNGKIWDETAKQMLKYFNERGQQLNVVPVGFHWDMNEKELKQTLVDADGQVQEELVKLAQEIQKIIRDNYKKSLEDGAEAYNKILTSAEKLLELERQLAELERERANYNGKDSAWYKAQDAKIKAKKLEIEQAKRDAYKESSDYLNFYDAILSLTIPEAEQIGQKIRENLNEELKKGKISARQYLNEIKKIEEQLSKLRNGESNLSAFLSGGLKGLFANMKDKGDSQWQRGINDLQDAESAIEKYSEAFSEAWKNGDTSAMNAANAQIQSASSQKEGALAMIKGGQAMSNSASSAMTTMAVVDKIVHGIDGAVQGLKGTFDEIKEMYDSLGYDTESSGWQSTGTFFSAFSSASASATKGWDSLKNGDIGGVIQGVVGSFTGWITGIAKGWDAKMDRQIEIAKQQLDATNRMRESMEKTLERTLGSLYEYKTSQENIKKLREARNKTEEVDEDTYSERAKRSVKTGFAASLIGAVAGPIGAIVGGLLGNIFGAGTKTYTVNYYNDDTRKAMADAIGSGSYYDEQYALLFKQRDELLHQLESEQAKKDSDDDKIEDYKQQIADVKDEIENFAQDMAKALWDIDVKEWASQLGDALFEAWQKGENGAEAFRKKSSEIIANLAKNIATQKLIEVAMKPVLDAITSEMERTNGLLDATSTEKIANSLSIVGTTLPDSFNTLMDGIEAGVQRAGLSSLKDTETKSSVGSSIKSITENTADLLAGYINAIRADVSVNRTLAQSQVQYQSQIAANTLRNADAADKIYELLHRVAPDGTRINVR